MCACCIKYSGRERKSCVQDNLQKWKYRPLAALNDGGLSLTEAFSLSHFPSVQSRTEDKIERFKKAVEYFSMASKPRPPSMGPSPYPCE